ncbi:MFS general substrate transporter [Punctularia strigosozonata HHB-11173 SS5]|uniref:MFS general substrate transporter n=1 Tax=Punctularia strigosozonata (strain HHB-11173) TaxID=741275 RepID=R7S2I6_PUNST|nr:MFS general substrate transporter [Punctularia strigosozonata HHB-11173 SS5]EIN03461.1 MFS general substrate transporter [Punctularia strigosozonata HHB-11173 SS5]
MQPAQSRPDVDEKQALDVPEAYEAESNEFVDEALQLVGRERHALFSDEYNLQLRRKLDLWIPPLCGLVYFTQFLDKTSINYASIMGFPIVGQHYNLVSLAFYLGFLISEFPTVYLAQRIGRMSKYLGVNVIVWGVILMLHATASSFSGFFALRFFLGMCESCVAPILNLLICMFYKKNEQAQRISWFYCGIGLAQIVGGFVAYGISFYQGPLRPTYKLLYVIFGGLAILVGICVLLLLPDSPVHASHLSKEEKIAVLERIRDEQIGTENRKLKRDQILEAFSDVRTWLVVFMTMMTSIPQGGLGSFSNIIIRNFGYTAKETLILATPQGVTAILSVLLCAWYGDRKGNRMIPIVFGLLPTILGTALMIGFNKSGDKGVLLFGTMLRSSSGLFGSHLSSDLYHKLVQQQFIDDIRVQLVKHGWAFKEGPSGSYHTTINALTLTFFSIGNIMILALALRSINIRLNAKKRRVLVDEARRRGWTDEDIKRERDKSAFLDLTDKQNLFFTYTA